MEHTFYNKKLNICDLCFKQSLKMFRRKKKLPEVNFQNNGENNTTHSQNAQSKILDHNFHEDVFIPKNILMTQRDRYFHINLYFWYK